MKKKLTRLFAFIAFLFLSCGALTSCGVNNNDNTYRLVIAGMTDTEERRRSVDFTDYYYESELVLVTRTDSGLSSDIVYSYEDLSTILEGQILVSQTGTITYDMIDVFENEFGAIKANPVDSFTTASLNVINGAAFAFTAELPVAQSYVNGNDNLMLIHIDPTILGDSLNDLRVSIGIAKGNEDFISKINGVLEGISQEERNSIMTNMVQFNSNNNEKTDNITNRIEGENGTIIIGLECNYPSFNWTETSPNNYTYPISGLINQYAEGYDIEIAKILANELNMTLEVQKMDWDSLLPWATLVGEGSDNSVSYIISNYFRQFGYGIATTLFLAVIGTLGGLIIGLFLGLGRTLKMSPNDNVFIKAIKKVINFICYIYILIFRGTPMMIQGMIFFLGLPLIIPIDWVNMGSNVIFNGYFYCGCIVIVLNTAAYIGEIIRGGINSVDIGQYEGARSLGLGYFTTMFKIILPQALKNSIPSIGNEFIVNIKDSSVLNVIGLTELYGWGRIVINNTYNAIGVYFIVAIIYLILTLLFSLILKLIEKKLNGEVIFHLNYFRHFKVNKVGA